MKLTYKHTITACFIGYIVQAVINNFAPLLFLTFQSEYGILLSQITLLVTVNFGVQLLVDIGSIGFVDRIGYRASLLLAHGLCALGLVLLIVLPETLGNPFLGLLVSVVVYAAGGGLLETLVSPVVEACPTDNKEQTMSLLHSFYCWGHVGVVLISTLFFRFAGIENWKILALVWATIPVFNMVLFAKTPIAPLIEDEKEGLSLKRLCSMKIFWILFIMMICSGASEQAVSQWASTLAEEALGVSKTVGDLAGPMAFAALMGSARAFYGKFGNRIDLHKFMIVSCVLCIGSYLGIALFESSVLSLVSCALCGLSVGIMWPGSFSSASESVRGGGTAMFALLALGGDIGCSGGPTFAGMMAGVFGGDLKKGILCAVVFPVLMLILLLFKKNFK